MGMNSALKTREILNISHGILCIEMLAAAQGLDFRDFDCGKGTRAAYESVREAVAFLDVDRPLFRDHNAMQAQVAAHKPLAAVVKAVGELTTSFD